MCRLSHLEARLESSVSQVKKTHLERYHHFQRNIINRMQHGFRRQQKSL